MGHLLFLGLRDDEDPKTLCDGIANDRRIGERFSGGEVRSFESIETPRLMRARLRKGEGWKRWSSEWIYRMLGLFDDYRLSRSALAKAVPVPEGV